MERSVVRGGGGGGRRWGGVGVGWRRVPADGWVSGSVVVLFGLVSV